METRATPNTLVRIDVRGLEIDAQCGKGGVVNLVVRAEQQHQGVWGRFRQHLAHALFRAGDACHPGHNHSALRVVLPMVADTPVKDGLPKAADHNVREVWPIHAPNGDAYYMALLAHEGVKRHHDGRPVMREGGFFRGQKSADDCHDDCLVIRQGNVADGAKAGAV